MGDYRPKIEQRIVHELRCLAILLVIALMQTGFAPTLWYFRIDWVLLAVVCMTLLHGIVPGLRWALYGGLALDILSPLPLGSHLLGLVLAVTAVAVLTDGFPRDNRLVPTVTVILVSLFYAAMIGGVMSAIGRPVIWTRYPITIMLPGALANGALALPVYLLVERLSRGSPSGIELET